MDANGAIAKLAQLSISYEILCNERREVPGKHRSFDLVVERRFDSS